MFRILPEKKDLPDRMLLDEAIRKISEECIECRICVKQCAFLKRYGTPKYIADRWTVPEKGAKGIEFECSLCSLCTAVCPVDIDPRRMFNAMRRFAFSSGTADLKKQKRLLDFEKRGTSRRYSFYGLPQGCHTVFFPGCALAGSRSNRVIQVFDLLQRLVPDLGIVLDCCTKPSHDLGRAEYFHAMFNEMQGYLLNHGVKKVLTACPSCYVVFNTYSDNLATQSIYEVLSSENWQPVHDISGNVTVQDSCVVRFEYKIQESVRNLIQARGISYTEMKHYGKNTLCCGEGGGAYFTAPELAGQWGAIRRMEAGGKRIITYCAGCANFLGKTGPAAHLLDLLFDPVATLKGRARATRSPVTYLKRLLLKRRFRKRTFAHTRERDYTAPDTA